MIGTTYRLICLWFALLLGIEQAWLTWTTGAMYVPPTVLLTAMATLLGGLIGKGWLDRGRDDAGGCTIRSPGYHDNSPPGPARPDDYRPWHVGGLRHDP